MKLSGMMLRRFGLLLCLSLMAWLASPASLLAQ
jgi:hypothetical protein